MVKFLDCVLTFVRSCWQKACDEAAKALSDALPPSGLVESGKVLTEQDRFATLSGAVKALNDSGSLSLGKKYQELKTAYEADGGEPNSVDVSNLIRLKNTARRVIAIEWACGQILRLKPEDIGGINIAAVTIVAKLKSKGVGTPKGITLPAYLEKTLERMSAHKNEAAAGQPAAAKDGGVDA